MIKNTKEINPIVYKFNTDATLDMIQKLSFISDFQCTVYGNTCNINHSEDHKTETFLSGVVRMTKTHPKFQLERLQ